LKRGKRRKPRVLIVLVVLALLVGLANYQIARNYGVEAELAVLKNETSQLLRSAPIEGLDEPARVMQPTKVWQVYGRIAEFGDCFNCPRMRVIPPGEFTMGSSSRNESDTEKPHRVLIMSPFAVSKYEVTFDQWNVCVANGGCGDHGRVSQKQEHGSQPVTDVTWNDAKDYVSWLSASTGKQYRLLSEAEWEYAARAGTATSYFFGDTITPEQARYADRENRASPQQAFFVGSFPSNAFGLHDMHGNVWEWVEDCWHEHYTKNVPIDGSAWKDEDCDSHVLRGGSWIDSEYSIRSASRASGNGATGTKTVGIRIARTL
jgi:formylglycine-generating enzyme required for sulfatase activity